MKLLAFDIETAPALVYTFSLFKPYLGPDHIVEPDRMICWAAQWVGDKPSKVMFASEYHDGRRAMLQQLRDLVAEADAVLTYNGKSFDVPWLIAECVLEGIDVPPDVRHIDLYQVQRKMKHISGKLQYQVGRYLNERKLPHMGLQMWIDCISPSVTPEAKAASWRTMKRYCKHDTELLGPLYETYRPLLRGANAINVALVDGIDPKKGCPNCGSTHFQRRGKEYTSVRVYHRLQCQDCKSWWKGDVIKP